MIIKLPGAQNVRDFSSFGLSGYLRSAHLNTLRPEGVDLLVNKYHLKTIIDLRTTQERKEKPDAAIPGVTNLHIPIFDDAVPGVSHEEETDSKLSMIPDMKLFYQELITKEPYLSQIKKALAVIEDPKREGAILWHCTEGKDRCGIISALFLLSHNAEPKAVLHDYLLTNRTNLKKAWKYYGLVLLSTKRPAAAAKVRNAFLAKPSYIKPLFEKYPLIIQ